MPDSLVAIELGLQLQNAQHNARLWAREYHRLVDLIWEQCEARGWPRLEMTRGDYDGWTVVAPDDDQEVDHDQP